jgi:hypothetical protein
MPRLEVVKNNVSARQNRVIDVPKVNRLNVDLCIPHLLGRQPNFSRGSFRPLRHFGRL